MKEKFDIFLKNGLSPYDAKYLNDFQYVMLLCQNGKINPYFANYYIESFIEYPDENKTYDTPDDVLLEEMNLTNSSSGVIYENIDGKGNFVPIAYIDGLSKSI